MPYPFPTDIYKRVRAQIETGLFESEGDVIREAIDSLEKRQHGLEKIRVMVREADLDIVAGRIAPFDAEESKRIVRQRLADHDIRE